MKLRCAVTAYIAAVRAARSVDRLADAAKPSAPPTVNSSHFNVPVLPEYRSAYRDLKPAGAAVGLLIASAALIAPTTPAHAQTYDWGGMAIISSSMGVSANQLCVGESTRGDIGCPTWAPTATTAGLEVSGTVSAAHFVGDGSGLTGLNASNVSITTGASGSLVFRDGNGSLMASSGLSISSTTGSVGIGAGAPSWVTSGLYSQGILATASGVQVVNGPVLGISNSVALVRSYNAMASSNAGLAFASDYMAPEAMRIVSTGYVGIGTAYPSSTLHVAGSGGGISGGLIIGAMSGSAQRAALFPVGTGSAALQIINTGGGLFVRNGLGNTFAIFDTNANGLMVGLGSSGNLSATLHVMGSALTTSWTGINFSSYAKVTPTAPLEVSGTISATALVINGQSVTAGATAFASLTDVSYSGALGGGNIFGPGSLGGAVNGITRTTALGIGALNNTTSASTANSAFGHYALLETTGGSFNTAMGKSALQYNKSGGNNSAFGNAALLNSMNGSGNTAVGNQAQLNMNGGSLNTAVGYGAGTGVSGSSSYNRSSLVGTWAGQGLTTGNENTLLGYNAGGGITTGSSNTVIGTNVSPHSNTGSNQLAIANAIWGDIGNGSTLQAKIGINVTSPTATLTVSGTISATRFVGDGSGLTGIAPTNDNISSGTAYVKALQNTGALVSGVLVVAGQVSATGAMKGNTLQLVDDPADTCSTANAGAIKRANGRFYYCRP